MRVDAQLPRLGSRTASRASTSSKSPSFAAEAARGIVRGGESAATRYGREIHRSHDYGPGFVKEFRDLPSGARPDAVNLRTREVVELKPDTPAAIRRGEAQLRRYASELNQEYPGPPFTTRLVTYPPHRP